VGETINENEEDSNNKHKLSEMEKNNRRARPHRILCAHT